MPSAPANYSNYLKIHELLDLQHPKSDGPEHDETLFIVIHQVYELWFKQILHEVDHLIPLLTNNEPQRALHTLNRILKILKVLVAQIDILETMTPLEYKTFRERLGSGSGFQSAQFREFEFMLGYKRLSILKHFSDEPADHAKLEKRYHDMTLWDAFLHILALNGHPIPDEILNRDITQAVKANEAVQDVLVDVYRNDKSLAPLCERLVDLDEGLQEWRYRHVKMVERTIGSIDIGTGKSGGVSYLLSTIQAAFPDLWAIRSRL